MPCFKPIRDIAVKILQINPSAQGVNGNSSKLASQITDALLAKNPQAQVTLRDLSVTPADIVDGAALGALFTPAEQRNTEQQARVERDDVLIKEAQEHDVYVIGVPMYNYGIPVQLKSWIDAICRARVTFRYTEQGTVEGLLKGKKVYLALARGGKHRNSVTDTQEAYMRAVLGFLGITDIQPIYAEGLQMGDAINAQGWASAAQEIAQYVA